MTGADSPVIAELVDRGDAFDHFAVAGDEFARLDQHQVAEFEIERRHAFIDVLHAALVLRINQPFGV